MSVVRLKRLITGTGRSGTQYIHRVLRAHGLVVGHERNERDGMVSWLAIADDPGQPIGEYSSLKKYDVKLHQVRHPLDVITSKAHTANSAAWQWSRSKLGIKGWMPETDEFALFWLKWNEKCEKACDWTYRVEALHGKVYAEWCGRLWLAQDPSVIGLIPTTIGQRERKIPRITWDDIQDKTLRADVQAMAARYGYGVDDGNAIS